jgi:hypothetical protein
VQLYQVGTGGYGASASVLSTATTLAGGAFSFPTFMCPSASTQVYLTAIKGNSGYMTNNNIALMAALGSCGNLGSIPFITLNEVTTVASVYALSPFMTGPANVGTTPGNTTGLANAFADVNTLANIQTGTSPGSGLPVGTTVPTNEIYTLADDLAACVNSGGGTAGDGGGCGDLFSYTKIGSTAPTDTITAMMNIAQNPAAVNVMKLYQLATPASPFQPTLTTQPNDFTVAVNYTGGGITAPVALAADASGNIWIANSASNTVTGLAHTGAPLSGSPFSASFNSPSSVAIDSVGSVWVTNKGNNTVSKLTSSGGVATGSPFSGGGLNAPRSIAFDSLGTAWIANSGNVSVTTITSGGVLANYTPAAATMPIGIAVNPH